MSEDLAERKGYAEFYNGGTYHRKVKILDSTLREGEQHPGIKFTERQRVQVGWLLDYLGVDSIEISPIVSESHRRSCKSLVKAGLRADIVAYGRALKEDIESAVLCDAQFYALNHSVSDIHLKYKLKVSREEALRRTLEAVDHAKSHGLGVRVTMEDASRADPAYVREFAKALYESSVDRIGVSDTVGALKPSGMYRLMASVREVAPVPLDAHCHNDLGLALANALAAYEAGADQIHVTVGGIGERVGITDLAQLVISLYFLYGIKLDIKYGMLPEIYKTVEEYTGISIPENAPVVGHNAYRHKAGTHIAAVLNSPATYELVPPEMVGARRKIIFSELLGKNGARFLLNVLGINANDETARSVVQGFKNLQLGDLFELEISDDLEKRMAT